MLDRQPLAALVTALVGGVRSIVFDHVLVTIGALVSKTIDAELVTCVPSASPATGITS